MAHPLYGARLKVVRAQEHLESFDKDAWRYVNTEPCEAVFKKDGDDISVEGIIKTEPPPALACILGDFGTNLRAALDYIAWELFTKFRPVTHASLPARDRNRIERQVQFPIVGSQTDFAKANSHAQYLRGASCGVPTTAMSVIESVQPYNAGYEPLSTLDLLIRTDKHRMLLLCALFVRSAGKVSICRGNRLIATVEGMTGLKMNLAAIGPSDLTTTEYSMKVDQKPTVFVALKDLPTTVMGVGPLLHDVLKCVQGIIPRFDQFFP